MHHRYQHWLVSSKMIWVVRDIPVNSLKQEQLNLSDSLCLLSSSDWAFLSGPCAPSCLASSFGATRLVSKQLFYLWYMFVMILLKQWQRFNLKLLHSNPVYQKQTTLRSYPWFAKDGVSCWQTRSMKPSLASAVWLVQTPKATKPPSWLKNGKMQNVYSHTAIHWK